MALKIRYKEGNIINRLKKNAEIVENIILQNLMYLGEEAVREARLNGSYIDRTGNLRSSIGYIIFKGGKVVSKGGFNGTETGLKKGEELALKLSSEKGKNNKYILIVVAGMSYAVYVEAKQRIVLSSAENLVFRRFPQVVSTINKALRK